MLLRRITKHVKDQNWFAVGIDFCIVVIGVFIGIQVANWNDARQQRASLTLAEADVNRDLLDTYFNAKERASLRDCRISRIQTLSTLLLETEGLWNGPQHIMGSRSDDLAIDRVLRFPSRNWGSRIWEAELTRGTFNLMDSTKRQNIDSIFKQSEHAERLQGDLLSLGSRLKILSQRTEISRSDRLRYFEVLSEIDEKSFSLELISGQISDSIEDLNIPVSEDYKAGVVVRFPAYIENRQEFYGDCAKIPEFYFLGADDEEISP
ncbi:MAG: hypothetical protein AAFO74_12730 [Pseudomonadota bacterium]